ncbi:unannotated protein [freshwater metagenome]|uniref:Unannotated protein n=1 Tax=freshwater metagenome TaxID=449393 RepID=A0A6J6PY24_9ZZZZ
MRSAKRRTCAASSLAASTASAKRASAPTGVFNSWLTLATKSRRTASTLRSSAKSSISTSSAPVPRAATRTRNSSSSRPSGGRRTRISCSRGVLSSITRSIRCEISGIVTKFRLTRPSAMLRELARSTVPSGATTIDADGSTLSTRTTSSGTPISASRWDAVARRGVPAAGATR